MPIIQSGFTDTITIQVGERIRVDVSGSCDVTIDGITSTLTTSKDYGKYESQKLLGISNIKGSVKWDRVLDLKNDDMSMQQAARTDITGVVASTEGGDLLLPNGKIKGIKEYLQFCFPCNQTGTSQNLPLDYSGKAIPASYGVNLSAPWSSAGYLSTPGGSNQHIVICPRAQFLPDFFVDSFSLSFVVRKAAPVAEQAIFGNGSSSTNRGIYFIARTDGKLQVNINTNNGGTGLQAAISASVATVFDNADHHVFLTLDAPNKRVLLYIDGVLDSTGTYTITASTLPVNDLTIGRAGDAGNAVSVSMFGVAGFIFTNSGMPVNNLDLVRLIFQSRRAPGLSAELEAFF